jgi:hypothetical protein
VSQACGINPQVFLVLLQKEQSLVTDVWPFPVQYRSATGYGCPDTAACDSAYYGFYNQVYRAGWQYKVYRANPNSYNYRAGRNNYIQYNPNASCGGKTVYIENQATAGLYIYTPYVPNAKALSNLYGTGDSCSAYGNRNFWRLFREWFGNSSIIFDNTSSIISGGVYEIRSKLNASKTLTIANESTDSSARTQIWDSNGSDAQRFKIVKNSDNTYTLVNVKSGKALDVPSAIATAGEQLWQWDPNGTNAQKWLLHRNSDGSFTIVSTLDQALVIDVSGAATINGTATQLWSYNATDAQKWTLNLVPDTSLKNDSYKISSALGHGQHVEVGGASDIDGAKIQIFAWNGTRAQKFKLIKNNDNSYTIINKNSGKAIDVPGANAYAGAKVQQWTSNGTDAQKWLLYRHDNGQFTFVSKLDVSFVLDVFSGLSDSGTALQLYSYNGTDAQKFTLDVLPADHLVNGNYTISSNLDATKAIDISGASKVDGIQAQIWIANNTDAQKFTVVQNDDNSYTIINKNSGKAIDVPGANAYAGAKVQQWTSNGTDAQKWTIIKNNDNSYTFISRLNDGLVLDVINANTASGTKLQLWYANSTLAQKWTLRIDP